MKTTVYGMYTGEDENNTDVFPLIASFVASGFGFGSGLEGATTGLFEDLLTGAAAVPSPADAEVPKAYLKYFIFNREMQMTQHGHVLLDETALNNWQKLELEIPIQTNGYIYIYVANESMADVNVHFDDMEVTLIEGSAVNGADYYPFGLAMPGRSWSSEGYRFGYQGQFAEKDDETGWNAFELRMYDPVIGRWMVPDPKREFWSPYVAMGNNPINLGDPTGGQTDPTIAATAIGLDIIGAITGFGSITSTISQSIPYVGAFVAAFTIGWTAGEYMGNNLQSITENITDFLISVGISTDVLVDPRITTVPPEAVPYTIDLVYRNERDKEITYQYSLRATRDGLYPVMVRGKASPIAWKPLKTGEVWKYGTYKSGTQRYSEKLLKDSGLILVREFRGTKLEALTIEKLKITNHLFMYKELPYGNKIIR